MVSCNDIAAQNRWWFIVNAELMTKGVEYLRGKKRDLPFVGRLVIEKTVAANSAASYTFNFVNFDGRMFVRQSAMMSKKVMSGRNVEMKYFHVAIISLFYFASFL